MEVLKITGIFFFRHILILNLLLAVVIVFFERRSPKSVWAWLLLLFFIPVAGFVFYLLLGTDLRKRKIFQAKEFQDNIQETLRRQEIFLKSVDMESMDSEFSRYTDLVLYNMKTSGAILSNDNDVEILTDGNVLFEQMIDDLRKARSFIHIQYYIIRDDVLLERILQVCEEKVKQGVEVRILFDAMGCRTVNKKVWKKVERIGIAVAEFFPALFGRFHLRMNYRNHRKIVVIDNRIGYLGGFNVGKEYIGLDDKFGYWRDTHLRIAGGAVAGLEFRFLQDWNYAAGESLFHDRKYYMFPPSGKQDLCKVQIISSGPDKGELQIRNNYLRLIHKARKSIYIQTPYFVPDDAILDSLLIAIRSDIEVYVMIPCMPDHPFVYWATYSYIGDLVMAGAKCYTYDNGFLHAKGMVVDSSVFCYGTANMDIRSFALNFEVNAIVYDEKKALEMERIFREDLEHGTQITKDLYAGRPLQLRVKEQVSRLLSPLL